LAKKGSRVQKFKSARVQELQGYRVGSWQLAVGKKKFKGSRVQEFKMHLAVGKEQFLCAYVKFYCAYVLKICFGFRVSF
jgi:hypothetical protein